MYIFNPIQFFVSIISIFGSNQFLISISSVSCVTGKLMF